MVVTYKSGSHCGAGKPQFLFASSGCLLSSLINGLSAYCSFRFYLFVSCLSTPSPPQHKTQKDKKMDLTIKDFDEKEHVVEVGVDDALGHLRLKVASAAGLQEDSFQMTFKGEVLCEEEGIKELSAGDTIMLVRTTNGRRSWTRRRNTRTVWWTTPP